MLTLIPLVYNIPRGKKKQQYTTTQNRPPVIWNQRVPDFSLNWLALDTQRLVNVCQLNTCTLYRQFDLLMSSSEVYK